MVVDSHGYLLISLMQPSQSDNINHEDSLKPTYLMVYWEQPRQYEPPYVGEDNTYYCAKPICSCLCSFLEGVMVVHIDRALSCSG